MNRSPPRDLRSCVISRRAIHHSPPPAPARRTSLGCGAGEGVNLSRENLRLAGRVQAPESAPGFGTLVSEAQGLFPGALAPGSLALLLANEVRREDSFSAGTRGLRHCSLHTLYYLLRPGSRSEILTWPGPALSEHPRVSFSLSRQGTRGSERCSNLPKGTQVANGRDWSYRVIP